MHDSLSQFSVEVLGQQLSRTHLSDTLAELRALSPTLHPYGFIIFRFHQVLCNHQLRCHVWLPDFRKRQQPDWPPHSHNSNLHSLVVRGAIVNVQFEFSPLPDGDSEIYEVIYSDERSFLKKTGICGEAREKARHQVHTYSNYVVLRNTYHTTEVPVRDCAMTIVLLSSDIEGRSRVLGKREAASQYEFNRLALDAEPANKAKQLVDEVLTNLAA